MSRRIPLILWICVSAMMCIGNVWAEPIAVSNASFELEALDPGGWTNALQPAAAGEPSSGWIGRNGGSDGGTFIEHISGFHADGNQHLGMQNNYYVFQNTGVPWEANTVYTLTVAIGNRNAGFSPEGALAIIGLTTIDAAPDPDNRLADMNANEMIENDPWLAVAHELIPPPMDESTFEDAVLIFQTGDALPAGNVAIFLGDDASTGRAHFDHVRLETTPVNGGDNPLDPDGDGILTPVEEKHGLDPNVADADTDHDNDGLTANVEIFERGTLANDPDTDGDGLLDGVETGTGVFVDASDTGTDPVEGDTDGDGLSDGAEIAGTTSPLKADTDEDGFSDGKEVSANTDPTDPNSRPSFPVVIGYWPFDDPGSAETAELGPSAIVSTVNGDPEWVTGHTGQPNDFAIKFDGVDDSVTTEVSLLNDLPELTMSFWVRMEEEQLGNRIGLVGQNDAVEYGMIDPATMQWWSPAGSVNVPFGPTIEDWTHVAVVLDAEGFKVFANGEIIGESAGGGPVSSGDSLNIGGDGIFDNAGNYFLGEIDDVAIWDEALTDQQIVDLASKAVCPLGTCATGSFDITELRRAVDGQVDLTWESLAGLFYDVEHSPDLTPGSWQVVLNDFAAAGGEALLTSAIVQGDEGSAASYFRVVQVPPPPFLEEGFEGAAEGWEVSLFAGGTETATTWEFGAPTNGPSAAKTGDGVAGTDLDANYANGTTIQLRSPVIDTAGATGVKLSFAYYLDALEGEGGRVNLLEENGDLIQSLEPLFTGGDDGNTADWTEASIRLPSLDTVRSFIIEFQFLTAGDGSNGAGWFIDDVRVAK